MEWCKYCIYHYPSISYPHMTVKSTDTLKAEVEVIGDESRHEEGEGEGMPGMEAEPLNQLLLSVDQLSGKKQSLDGNDQLDRPPNIPYVTHTTLLVGFNEQYGVSCSCVV